MPQQLLGFAVVCIALSVGLQKRQLWVWYAVWALFLFFAIQIAALVAHVLSTAQTTRAAALGCTGAAGIALFWTPIAIWWAKRRNDFGKPRAHSTKPPPNGTKKPDANTSGFV
ncbi:hypothetical protein CMV30_08875 [Nibricoccus aquaticus]|uniref:Uncharacterized protein n=1 Tax=Nibricoccus aquaticus TaxID=2576891 RepID=A0A290Q6D5_9BACT|nr:hypothetical protein [Nibricoccus aquaticus]ATC64054.1 hypothetical protein CMV30_08875 [Nibricoccus aquaticus]